MKTIESEHYHLIFEGYLYDREVTKDWLREVVDGAFQDRDIASELTRRDGEFVLVGIEKATSKVAIVTDVLGRLPLYIASIDGDIVISREIQTIRSMGSIVESPPIVDRVGAAQYLLFSYPLGDRTLFDGIHRLPPAAVVTAGANEPSTVSSYHTHRYDHTAEPSGGFESAVTELADRFLRACRQRVAARPKNHPVVSLSGGLDSRVVAAGLVQSNDSPSAATMARSGVSDAELNAAETVGDKLQIPWKIYEVAKTQDGFDKLLELKQGQNYLSWAHLLPFYDQLRTEYGGEITLFAGGGGDKVLPSLRPQQTFSSDKELTSYILRRQSTGSVVDAATVAGVSRALLRGSVYDRIQSYPEDTPAGKYIHFQVHERGSNWLVENEDLVRQYCWGGYPFWAWPVFEFGMKLPDRYKERGRLQRRFIAEVNEQLLPIPYADTGAPITTPTHKAKEFGYAVLERYLGVREWLKSVAGIDTSYGDLAVEQTNEALRELDHTALATRATEHLNRDGLTSQELYTTLTLLSVIHDVDTESSVERIFAPL